MAEKNIIFFFECSAINDYNVNDIFNNTASMIIEKIGKEEYDLSNDSCVIKQGRKNDDNVTLISYDDSEKKDVVNFFYIFYEAKLFLNFKNLFFVFKNLFNT